VKAAFVSWRDALALARAAADVTGVRHEVYRDPVTRSWRVSRLVGA
jgi:formylglycine-generating enzyme required for sulfatase activity